MMRTQEEWKPVVGYEDFYEVSDLGRVKSVPRKGTKGGILKPSPDGGGYLQVKLYKNGEKSIRGVHILVMRAFKGKCPENHQVDHIDWNPENNILDNLRYLPAKENDGRKSPEWYRKNVEKNKKRAKPVDQLTLDGIFIKRWPSAADAEKELGVHRPNITKCCKGKRKTAGGFIWRFAD